MNFLWDITPFGPPEQNDSQRLERIRFLMQFPDDATLERWGDTLIEMRDFAASRLAGLLGFSVRRQIDSYRPVHDDSLGPLMRILFRELMRQTAAKELAAAK